MYIYMHRLIYIMYYVPCCLICPHFAQVVGAVAQACWPMIVLRIMRILEDCPSVAILWDEGTCAWIWRRFRRWTVGHCMCHVQIGPRKNVPWAKYFEIFGLPMKPVHIYTDCLAAGRRRKNNAKLRPLLQSGAFTHASPSPALSAPVSPCSFLAAINFCSTTFLHGQCEACVCALRMPSNNVNICACSSRSKVDFHPVGHSCLQQKGWICTLYHSLFTYFCTGMKDADWLWDSHFATMYKPGNELMI